jgi:hypothetical protein
MNSLPSHRAVAAGCIAVLANFPKEFLSGGKPPTADQHDPEDHSRTCAAVFSRKDDGSPDLIAAIYDGDRTEVAMLAYEQDAVRMIDTVDDRQFNLGGEFCSIQIINLADPADSSSPLAKTVVASFDTNLRESDYYFVWSGKKLVNISPRSITDRATRWASTIAARCRLRDFRRKTESWRTQLLSSSGTTVQPTHLPRFFSLTESPIDSRRIGTRGQAADGRILGAGSKRTRLPRLPISS